MNICQSFFIPSLCAPALRGARTGLPLPVSIQVLPLFERFLVSNDAQSQVLLFSPFAFLNCTFISCFFSIFLSTHQHELSVAILLSKRQLMHYYGHVSFMVEWCINGQYQIVTRPCDFSHAWHVSFFHWASFKNKSCVCAGLCSMAEMKSETDFRAFSFSPLFSHDLPTSSKRRHVQETIMISACTRTLTQWLLSSLGRSRPPSPASVSHSHV